MSRFRSRRLRRSNRMRIRSRGKFKVGHKSKSGRTGKIHSTQMKSRRGKRKPMTLYRRPPRCYQRHLPNRCDRCGEIEPLPWRSGDGKFYCEGCGVVHRMNGARVKT